jgi:hypothetical protein
MSGWWTSPVVAGVAALLRVAVGAYFLFLAYRTLSGDAQTLADYQRWGYPDAFRILVGLGQLAGGAGLLLPQVSLWAGALLAVILVGAVGTHARHDAPASVLSPLLFLVLVAASLLPRWAAR